MGKIMSTTTPQGFSAPTAYWLPVQVTLDKVARTAQIVFYGYLNQDARNSLKMPLDGASKVYGVSGADYDAYFSEASMQGTNIFAQCYKLAMATLDANDAKGNAVSFFSGATDSAT